MSPHLVLIAGLVSNDVLWKHQKEHLSHLSSIHLFSPSQNNPEQMVESVLQKAPPTFALAGHSMGGWLCLEIMRISPSRVTQLCLINTTARPDSEEKHKRRQAMIYQVENGHYQEVIQDIVDHFVFNPLVKEQVQRMFLEVGPDAFIRQQQAMMIRKDSFSILPTISCPTLIIHAAEDKNFSLEEHQELAARIRNSKLAIIEDTGHMSPLEGPQAITSLLRLWLSYPSSF